MQPATYLAMLAKFMFDSIKIGLLQSELREGPQTVTAPEGRALIVVAHGNLVVASATLKYPLDSAKQTLANITKADGGQLLMLKEIQVSTGQFQVFYIPA